jgi:hypothetical protein
MNGAKYREILDENPLQSAQHLRMGRRFTFQQDNDTKHTTKTAWEWLRDKSLNVLEGPCQSPDFNPIDHLWGDLKIAEQQCSSSNLTELEDLQRRMGETPQIQVCQACSVLPKKTRGCNQCQLCFNKVLSKWSEYFCKCDKFSIFNTFAKMSTCFCSVIMEYCV